MSLSFEKKKDAKARPVKSRGVSLAPSTFETHMPDSVKDSVIDTLSQFPGAAAAAKQLDLAEFVRVADVLEIRTQLDSGMLHLLFSEPILERLSRLLKDNGVHDVIKLKSAAPGKFQHPAAPQSPQVNVSLDALRKSAAKLNSVSDQLSEQIEILDVILKELNFGVTCWVDFEKSSDEDGTSYEDWLGYTKFSARWCIAIRSGYERPDGFEREETWPFADAPRNLRIKAADKLPELIARLSTEAEKMVSKLSETVQNVERFTRSLKEGA